jgi:Flagellar hook-length control protein FliK
MDLHQLSPQIGIAPASGELLAFGASLGVPSQESRFSSVLQAASKRVDARREAKSPASQAEREDRPTSTTKSVHRGLSSKAEGSRGMKLRAPHTEHESRLPGMTQAAHRSPLNKTAGTADREPGLHQAETDDQPSPTASDAPMTLRRETSSSTDTESQASQSESGDDPSLTPVGSSSPQVLLVEATMVMPISTVDSTQNVVGSDILASEVGGLSVLSESLMSQPTTQAAEEGARLVSVENGLGNLVDQRTALATGDTMAIVSPPTPGEKPGPETVDTVIPVVVQSEKSLPHTAPQIQKAESIAPGLGIPLKGLQERDIPQAPVPSGQDAAEGQALAQQAVPATAQLTGRNGEGIVAQPDRSPVQPILSEAEPSLHQKNALEESPEPHTAEALSGYVKAEGRGPNAESDGQKKEESLKRFSHVDLQSVEVSSRRSQELASDSHDSGPQYPSYQQGQGGTPSNIKSVSAPAVSASTLTNPLSQDPETAPAPLTHAVQFDLAPADFGQLRVRLVMSDQTVHTHLSTDRPDLGQMLTSRQEQLSTQLSSAGLDLGRFQVQVNQERANQSGQEWSSQAHGGTSQQQQDSREQEHSPETPVPSQKRTGVLSLFA